jgi:hypothetical protein
VDNDYIETQLKKFNITDAKISELQEKYTSLDSFKWGKD